MYKRPFLLILFFSIVINTLSQAQPLPLIPLPAHLATGNGNFVIKPATVIVIPKGYFKNEVAQLNELMAKGLGKRLKISNAPATYTIQLVHDISITQPEAYKLDISRLQITISAGEPAGIFHAIQTIRELLPPAIESGVTYKQLTLPAMQINDAPSYAWRGLHLDVSRHFFSIAYLRKLIDVMALYKMNKLHLHLTDDQGWRIEIKKYPKLTEEGAWRSFDKNDSACMKRAKDNPDFALDQSHIIHRDGKTLYGGFYTQLEMKALVAYAAGKHIDIIPELDMPGHMMAAINSYPFLTCNGENKWGELFSRPICPCNESTFEFAQNVYTEIMDIFPSKYIHIGGDEVDRSDWGKSAACKALMDREGIVGLPALQSYFINRMEKFFNSKGRKLIGWDEIIEGGISQSAMVMYWRTWVKDAPVKAAKSGNQVIMAPGEPLYFDRIPDHNTLDEVYHFNPIPKGLTEQQAGLIMGGQACTWTENIPSENRADYMIFPRLAALAENLWTNQPAQYQSYLQRQTAQYKLLDALHVHYRLPDLPQMVTENVFTDVATLAVKKPLDEMRIFYTTDSTLPGTTSTELKGALLINKSQTIKVAAFMPDGLRGDIYTLNYKKESFAEAVNPAATTPGLICKYFKGSYKSSKLMEGNKPDSTFASYSVSVPQSVNAPSFGLQYRGFIKLPADGIYTFYFTCDDGGILTIAGREVVDNDGWHAPLEKNGQVALRKGLQPFAIDFVEGGGGFTLKLKYSVNGSEPQEIPSSWLVN